MIIKPMIKGIVGPLDFLATFLMGGTFQASQYGQTQGNGGAGGTSAIADPFSTTTSGGGRSIHHEFTQGQSAASQTSTGFASGQSYGGSRGGIITGGPAGDWYDFGGRRREQQSGNGSAGTGSQLGGSGSTTGAGGAVDPGGQRRQQWGGAFHR